MAKTVSTTYSESDSWSKSHSETNSRSDSKSQSSTKKVLDTALRDQILSGLMGYMSEEEIDAYAKSLLAPALNAELEAAKQQYETEEAARKAEIDGLAKALEQGVSAQRNAYGRSMADIQTAALARGMGRSSYTLETMARQGEAMAEAIAALEADSAKEKAKIQDKISLAAKHSAQTKARLESDYADRLSAKKQELLEKQREAYNQHYLAATSGAMGTASAGQQQTTGHSTTDKETKSHTEGYRQTVTKRS